MSAPDLEALHSYLPAGVQVQVHEGVLVIGGDVIAGHVAHAEWREELVRRARALGFLNVAWELP